MVIFVSFIMFIRRIHHLKSDYNGYYFQPARFLSRQTKNGFSIKNAIEI